MSGAYASGGDACDFTIYAGGRTPIYCSSEFNGTIFCVPDLANKKMKAYTASATEATGDLSGHTLIFLVIW